MNRANAPHKLLAVSHNLNLEGASLSMFELMTALAADREIEVVALADGPLREHYEQSGIRVLDLPFEPMLLRRMESIYACVDGLAALICERGAGLLYANTLLGYPAILAGAQARVSTLWNIRESQSLDEWQEYLGERLALAFEAFGAASAVVFVAEATRALWAERVTLGSNYCIHNGLNLDHFAQRRTGISREDWRRHHGIRDQAVVFLCPGTVHERKGQRDLVEAVLGLPPEPMPVAVLLGDGGGAYSQSLHRLRAELEPALHERIVLLPRTYYMADAYAAADVLVCCSRNESYPRVVLEGLASGLPAVSTPVFGINEQVKWGTSALRYEPGDVATLRGHLACLQSQQALRARFGQAARARFQSLTSFEGMLGKYRSLLDGLAAVDEA